jgi:3-dehydroquinate dehydratase-1
MSMGSLGMISRISGELFGSALTFGSAKKASAPGQLEAEQLHKILHLLHR